jgi:hypothetical protein
MGVQVKLVMVGPYKGKNKTIKNVPFKNGVAYVRGPEDKIMHILKYLREYGAFPADQAEAEQAKVDAYLATQTDTSALLKRKADLKAQLAELEKSTPTITVLDAAADAPPPPVISPEPPPEPGEADVQVSNPETPEQRGGQQAESGKNSGKRGRNNR